MHPAHTAIAHLIDLAEQGVIDPWDVPVIQVIDRFLAELGVAQDLDTALVQTNLPRSGQAFLWASLLVRFKADTLERMESAEAEIIPELELLDPDNPRLPLYLEKHIRRRTAAPPPKKRPVTLQELITQLEEMRREIEQATPTVTPLKKDRVSRRDTLRLITELAHQENLTEVAEKLADFLHNSGEISLNFEDLIQRWFEPDRVGLFWALLLLCSQGKVELYQESFYSDLTIKFYRKER
jgi:segregation and condensation protein A